MRSYPRLVTQRGIGPDSDEITDNDILETDGLTSEGPKSGRVVMTCPPPSVSGTRVATRYSYVAPRRQTLSMAAVEGPKSRRGTLRLDYDPSRSAESILARAR
jgi:hypothetical protein